jgi:hypothetical protein
MYHETKAAMKFNPWLCVFPLGCMTTHDMFQNVQQQPMILVMQQLSVILLMLPKVKLVHGTPDDY